MAGKLPKVSVDILVLNKNKILLGLLTKKWLYNRKQVYGVPGREIFFNETIGQTVKRNIREEFGCNVTSYKIFCVNANYALGNHYIGIGITAHIDGEPINLVTKDWEKWEWFTLETLPHNLFPATENLIKSFLSKKINVAE